MAKLPFRLTAALLALAPPVFEAWAALRLEIIAIYTKLAYCNAPRKDRS
jgi:hypothetical protein